MISVESSGSFGMGSAYNADRHEAVSQMMSFRTRQLDMNMTVKSVSSRRERRERDGVQDRIDHGCPNGPDIEAVTYIEVMALPWLAELITEFVVSRS